MRPPFSQRSTLFVKSDHSMARVVMRMSTLDPCMRQPSSKISARQHPSHCLKRCAPVRVAARDSPNAEAIVSAATSETKPSTLHINALDGSSVALDVEYPQALRSLEPWERSQLDSIDEEPEVSACVLALPKVEMNYQRPKKHRRAPGNVFTLAARNFVAELKGIIVFALEKLAKPDEDPMPTCFGFTLDNDAIHAFDVAHPSPGREEPPFFIKLGYDVLLFFVDRVYEGKAIERFWFLETVARMPYFSYTTALHLYETLGWWRTGGLRLVHFAEEWNELHHLLIMEALGGDRQWTDRFLGQHAAVFYYWALVVAFLISPTWSYKFSEMLETHAVSTYRQFIIENADKLKQMPAPLIAKRYYQSDDPYLFNLDSGLVRGISNAPPRTPPCETLYDVFINILEDEWEHVKTMVVCQDAQMLESLKVSQTTFSAPEEGERRRELWNRWAEDIAKLDKMIELRSWEARKP